MARIGISKGSVGFEYLFPRETGQALQPQPGMTARLRTSRGGVQSLAISLPFCGFSRGPPAYIEFSEPIFAAVRLSLGRELASLEEPLGWDRHLGQLTQMCRQASPNKPAAPLGS